MANAEAEENDVFSGEFEALVDEARHEADDERRWELLTSATRAGPVAVRHMAERLLVSTEAVELATRLGDPRLHEPLVRLREGGWARASDPGLTAELEAVLSTAIEATGSGTP